jgi:hypothetical protein
MQRGEARNPAGSSGRPQPPPAADPCTPPKSFADDRTEIGFSEVCLSKRAAELTKILDDDVGHGHSTRRYDRSEFFLRTRGRPAAWTRCQANPRSRPSP